MGREWDDMSRRHFLLHWQLKPTTRKIGRWNPAYFIQFYDVRSTLSFSRISFFNEIFLTQRFLNRMIQNSYMLPLHSILSSYLPGSNFFLLTIGVNIIRCWRPAAKNFQIDQIKMKKLKQYKHYFNTCHWNFYVSSFLIAYKFELIYWASRWIKTRNLWK